MRFADAGVEVAVHHPTSGGFTRHSHDEFVISVNLTGSERVRLDGRVFDVGTDAVTTYNPGQVQSCTTDVADGQRWGCASIYVDPGAVTRWTGRDTVDMPTAVLPSAQLHTAVVQFVRHWRTQPQGQESEERLAQDTVALLARLIPADAASPGPVPPGDARVQRLLDRLRGDLANPIRIADLADEEGCSREQLIRTFTAATGTPPYAWQLQTRLIEARRRLRAGGHIATIAVDLGFADQAHLTRHFTSAYGRSPARDRRG
ncbi:AraC family transcriptional regulator [Modestobacter sp. Leaf380]|uniref:AraC family transcriptional regulator n=1 Tax=Modestobacter sp. Leaf380 TaxID=1736356 RepID=UPI0006FFA3F5|nr:AraC family transcriptional regulator [Modestobacter sp. Leaf380]KQS66659.1 hypothetical protein ASG41_09340 [Modestobacter sp. Leaf380]